MSRGEWKPLAGLDLEQTIFMMQSSKVYVDFGNHPGKDRIPREAAANGCCVITNKKGSAAFYEDVPIPEEYKLSDPENQKEKINCLIGDIITDFSKHQKRFKSYREWISKEKEAFERDVANFVTRLKY